MANKIELTEEILMKLGFRLLDIIYGELTIKKETYWNELFVDVNGDERLGYKKTGLKNGRVLGYLFKDRYNFLRMIPVKIVDYRRVLKAWVLERYKLEVDATTILPSFHV